MSDAATVSEKARRRMNGGEGFVIHICPDCGYAEGEMPQAGCCAHCGQSSDPLVCWATVNHHAEDNRG